MKVSLNWLTDYVDIAMPAAELAKALTRAGVNCEDIAEAGEDVVLDLEVTSNRPDLLGHVGVAREIAAITGAKFKPPVIKSIPTAGKVSELTAVEVLNKDLCPRYTARVIRGVKVGPSPAWLVERLHAVGMRSVNNVVDVTNYVLMEFSQPLHSFDYGKLTGRRIVVRTARKGERIVSIDGTQCELREDMLVIADAEKPVAVAGVMGGLDSEVGEKTVNILLESAQFDPLSVRRTSRRLGLMSESNYRFERGIDPVGVDAASLRACELICRLGGGSMAEGIVNVWAQPYEAPTVKLRPERCDALLGITVPPARQAEILDRLGLAPRLQGGVIACSIPPHRGDLRREADLIEEVARLVGYDEIPVASHVTHEVVSPGRAELARKELIAAMTAAGFDETLTISFIDDEEAKLFGGGRVVRVDPLVRKSNNILRPSLLPSLLRTCKVNQDGGNPRVDLFELASVFPPGAGEGDLPKEYVQLGLVTTRDLRALRGALESAVDRLAPKAKLELQPGGSPGLADGAAVRLLLDGEAFGAMGQVAANVLDYYGLSNPIVAATADFRLLQARSGGVRKYQSVPRFPSVQRDLSLIVEESVTWRQLADAIAAVAQPQRAAVEYVTTYRGKPVPAGRKSVTVTLVYRAADRTLRSEEVDEQVAQVVGAMKAAFGADLRT